MRGRIASVTQRELIKAGEVTWVNNAIVYPGGAPDLINKEIVCHSEEGHCVGVHCKAFFYVTLYTLCVWTIRLYVKAEHLWRYPLQL